MLRVTPTANRNTYSVAKVVGLLPRVADFVRTPGLGKRISYSVARGAPPQPPRAPPQPSPRGGSPIRLCIN